MTQLFIKAHEDKVDSGYVASAIGHGMHTQAETLHESRRNILDAVDCYFEQPDEEPTMIHLRIVSEGLAAEQDASSIWLKTPI